MLPFERRRHILSEIQANGKIENEALAKELNVSNMTIRRDLEELENKGKIKRFHGGAVETDALISEIPYQRKESVNITQKKAIADIAVNMVPEKSTLILDSGTTTLEIAKKIKLRDDLFIVTNDIHISLELLDSKSTVISTGGELQQGIGSFLGPHVLHLLEGIRADLLFLGAHAIDPSTGITAPTMEKASVKKQMISAANHSWVVSDSTKFDKQAFAKVCALDDMDGFITDDQLSDNQQHTLGQDSNIKLAVTKEG